SLLQRRQLEALFRGFLDYFEQNQFLMRLQHIAQDTGDVRGIVVGALQEFVKGRRDRIQQMVAALSEFRTLQIRATRFDPSPYE
ncbi:MAG: hypothetical protein LH632_00255, partial [Rhodoferax sp.]|nr:hypothetical protein [Rhodoferax sp.]